MTYEARKQTPFGIKDKLGYLFGDFGNDFTFLLSSGFLLKFYTDVMGISAWIVGLVMTVARFADAVTDVTMGRICDRSPIRAHGKFKPWIIRMAGPVAIASFLIYQSAFRDYADWFKITWLAVTYILWGSVFYTAVNIPYGSMASAISSDPHDRQSLSTYRTMGSTLAGVIVGVAVPLFAYTEVGGNPVLSGSRFTVLAGIFSILAVVCYILCWVLTTERVPTAPTDRREGGNILHLFYRSFKNRALVAIILASFVMLASQLTMQSMSNYVFPNYYGSTSAQSVATIVMMVSMIAAAIIAKRLAARFGKAEIGAVSGLFAAAVNIFLFATKPQNVWSFVWLSAFAWLGLGVFSMVSWALITDVIDYSEIKNGVREDGSVYAIYSFSRKLGQAAASGLGGLLLTLVGYSDKTAFEPSVLTGVFNIATLVPAVGLVLLFLVLWFMYPLHKKQVKENTAILAKRRKS